MYVSGYLLYCSTEELLGEEAVLYDAPTPGIRMPYKYVYVN